MGKMVGGTDIVSFVIMIQEDAEANPDGAIIWKKHWLYGIGGQ